MKCITALHLQPGFSSSTHTGVYTLRTWHLLQAQPSLPSTAAQINRISPTTSPSHLRISRQSPGSASCPSSTGRTRAIERGCQSTAAFLFLQTLMSEVKLSRNPACRCCCTWNLFVRAFDGRYSWQDNIQQSRQRARNSVTYAVGIGPAAEYHFAHSLVGLSLHSYVCTGVVDTLRHVLVTCNTTLTRPLC